MEALGHAVVWVVVVPLIGLAIWVAYHFEKKRREKLRKWASAGGWTWSKEKRGNPGWPFDLFRRGHSKYSRYHATRVFDEATPGIESCPVDLFEYHYAITSGSGKNRNTRHYYHTCVVAQSGMDLGAVSLRDEHFGDKLIQSVGFDDIDLEDPEFSSKFVLKASDRKDAYDLIDSGMMRYLVRHEGWTVETRGPLLLVYRPGRVSPESYDAAAGFALGFLAQVPRVVVNRARAERGLAPLLEAGGASSSSRDAREG